MRRSAFSAIEVALEESRRNIANEANYALDTLKTYKSGSLEDFESKEEIINLIEDAVQNILNYVSR